jgi:hypothetical protein
MKHFFMSRNDDIIVVATQILGHATHALANLPLRAVSVERGAARLHRDPEPEMAQVVRHAKNHAFGKLKNLILVKEPPVLPRVVEPTFVAQGLRLLDRSRSLLARAFGRQALTALSATALENLLTVLGFHASAETVTATALGAAGLVSSFHK